MVYLCSPSQLLTLGHFFRLTLTPSYVRCVELMWPCLCSLVILFVPQEDSFSLFLCLSLFCLHLSLSLSLRLCIIQLFSLGNVTVGGLVLGGFIIMLSHRTKGISTPKESIHFLLPERLNSLHISLGHLLSHYHNVDLIFCFQLALPIHTI